MGRGRGEWLGLLKGKRYEARGIDINRIIVVKSQESGLSVGSADVLDYLKRRPKNHLAAVTGFRIIEHLPLKTLLSFSKSRFEC